MLTKVAEVGREGKVVDVDLTVRLLDQLVDLDAPYTDGKVMFLLTGYFTSVAARAPLIVDQQPVFWHFPTS
ncbi:MAG: hypothetical protein QW815_06270 [Nitrososphaerota archaeon]